MSCSTCILKGCCAGDELDGSNLYAHMAAVEHGLARPGMSYTPQELVVGVRCAAEVLLQAAPRLMEVWACSGAGLVQNNRVAGLCGCYPRTGSSFRLSSISSQRLLMDRGDFVVLLGTADRALVHFANQQ